MYLGGNGFEFTSTTINGRAVEFSENLIKYVRLSFLKATKLIKPGESLLASLKAVSTQFKDDNPAIVETLSDTDFGECRNILHALGYDPPKPLGKQMKQWIKVGKELESAKTMTDVDSILGDFKSWLGNYRQTVNA